MATTLENLEAARDNYAKILRGLTEDALGNARPKMTYSVDGAQYSHTEYQAHIIDKMIELEKMIQRASARGGFEVRSQARSY